MTGKTGSFRNILFRPNVFTTLLIAYYFAGTPPPAVTWWRGSTLLDDTFDTMPDGVVRNELTITRLMRSDLLMVLTCNANNNNVTVPVDKSVKINLNCKLLSS